MFILHTTDMNYVSYIMRMCYILWNMYVYEYVICTHIHKYTYGMQPVYHVIINLLWPRIAHVGLPGVRPSAHPHPDQ